MSAKLLVTGAAGLLGSRVALQAQNTFQTTAAYHLQQTNLPMGCQRSVKVDLCDENAVTSLFNDFKFDLVINCAGASNVDLCETDREYATLGNFQTAFTLSKVASKFGARFFHISTDYVFNGESGPATEDFTPAPINFYGTTKLMAEEAVARSGAAHTIVRVCALYSKDLSAPPNPFKSIVTSLKNEIPYFAVDDLYSNPTEISNLARAICHLAETKDPPKLIHLAPDQYLSRYEFALQIAQKIHLDHTLIKKLSLASLNLKAPRPKRAGLRSLIATNFLLSPLSPL